MDLLCMTLYPTASHCILAYPSRLTNERKPKNRTTADPPPVFPEARNGRPHQTIVRCR
jgi:hypothetical protein